jgi:subtilisin-like proprotein convertase family protein
MWRRSLLFACAVLVPLVIAVPQAGAATFANTAPITIPNGAPDVSTGPASPYPSAISVAGVPANVADVDVTLNGLSHTCISDLRFLLVGPGSQNSILLDTAGGYCDDPVENAVITLDDEAPSAYPCNTSPSGTFRPTAAPETPSGDCEPDDIPFPAPAPGGPYPVALSAFDGAPASGTWSLFAFDQYSGDSGVLSGGWSLDVLPAASCAGQAVTSRTLVGTDGPDNLVGTPGPDVMVGFGGSDTISGLGANDVVCGGPGKDKLFGGPGRDLLRGEAGKDKLKGQGGKDTCVGGKGKDTAKACEKDKSI